MRIDGLKEGFTDQFMFGGLSFKNGLSCFENVLTDNDSYQYTSCMRDYDPITETCWPPTDSNETVELECQAQSLKCYDFFF